MNDEHMHIYKTLFDTSNYWEGLASMDHKLLYLSLACETISGYSRDAFMQDPDLLLKIILPEDRDLWLRHKEEHTTSIPQTEIMFRILRPDGEIRWIDHICKIIFNEDGQCIGRRFTNRDITKEVQNEKELTLAKMSLRHQVDDRTRELLGLNNLLLQRERHYRMLFEGSKDAIFIADAETGVILEANMHAEKMLGLSRDKIIGMHQSQLHPPEKAGACQENCVYEENFALNICLSS